MNDKQADIDGGTTDCDAMTSDWRLGPVDLSMPGSGLNMSDIKLEALCDVIFANLNLKTWKLT